VREEVDPDANIIFGSTFDPSMEGAMRVSIVATGIDAESAALPRPAMISLVHDADRTRKAAPAAPAPAPAAAPIDTVAAVERPDLIESAMAAQVASVAAEVATPAAVTTPAKPAGLVMPARSEPVSPAAFIAPRAVEPAVAEATRTPAPQLRRADPFAEAAMTNAPAKEEKRRGRSLFQRVTGAVNDFVSDDPAPAPRDVHQRREPTSAVAAPGSSPAPAQPAQPTPAPAAEAAQPAPLAEPAPQPVQTSLSNLDRKETSATSTGDDDMLEIPAFLRRQAN
jgi:cell division protein FtsZ